MKNWLLVLVFLPGLASAGQKYTYPNVRGMDDELDNVYHDIRNVPNGTYRSSSMTLQGLTVDSITINSQQSGITLGKLVQASSTTSSQSTLNVTSQVYQDTGLSLSFTMRSSTNKLRISYWHWIVLDSGAQNAEVCAKIKVLKDASSVAENFDGQCITANGGSLKLSVTVPEVYEISPGDTSAHTYKTQFANYQGNGKVNLTSDNGTSGIMILEEIVP